MNRLRTFKVDVQIPRFRIESSLSLDDALKSLGVRNAFVMEDADFTKMSDDPEGLYLGAVLHKTFFEVNEKGTEAAAATVDVCVGGSGMIDDTPKTFVRIIRSCS